ncbi:MAG: YbaK/EbsC family protein [Pseudomonadota bacterium]
MTMANRVRDVLTRNHTHYTLIPHPHTGSSAETAAAAHVPSDHIAKGVVLKDEDGYVLAVIPADRWLDLPRVRMELSRDLALAAEKEIEFVFDDCEPGAVPPFGPAYGVDTVLDEDLTTLAEVYAEAGDHENLIAVDGAQFQALLPGVRHGHFSEVH